MENIGKSFALILILTVAISGLSLMMIKPAFAQTPTPSVPEFNIATTNSSYSVPTTYSTEPYTGQNVTNAGYNVDDLNVTITIQNQPLVFTSTDFVYDIQVKGHYSTVWNDLFEFPESYLTPSTGQSTAISSIQQSIFYWWTSTSLRKWINSSVFIYNADGSLWPSSRLSS